MTKISENEWKIALSSILEELDEHEYKKMLLFLNKIPKHVKTSRSKVDMPQIIVQYYGVHESISVIKEAMQQIPRRDDAVQDKLRPFVEFQSDVTQTSGYNWSEFDQDRKFPGMKIPKKRCLPEAFMFTTEKKIDEQKRAKLCTNYPPEENQPDKTQDLVTILSEILKEQQKQTKLMEEIKAATKEQTAADLKIAECKERVNTANEMLNHILFQQTQPEAKCLQHGRFPRRNNIIIHLVPEGSQVNNIFHKFVEKLIKEELGVQDEILIERVEQVNGPRMEDNNHPRLIRVCFQNYDMRQTVLQAAWAKKDIRMNTYRVFFEEDKI